jgi:hypothetical protein
MKKKTLWTKVLAVAGTVLLWLPIAATLITAIIGSISARSFLFDYLMPAELFPLAFVGAGLLLWASFRAKLLVRPISWGLDAVIGLPVAAQLIAIFTGLANGDVARGGWQEILVTTLIGLYGLAIIATGILGIQLCQKLFKKA